MLATNSAEFRAVIEAFGPIKDRVGMCRDGEVRLCPLFAHFSLPLFAHLLVTLLSHFLFMQIRPYTAASPDSGRIDTMINVLDTSRKEDGSGGPGATRWHTDDSYCEVPCAYT